MNTNKIKVIFDIVISLILLIILSPFLLILILIIGRDGGKAIYGQERIGLKGKKFKCYKFRSMVINSQEVLSDLLENNPAAKVEWERDFKLKNDPRITKFGHFIRRTSIDELPQLWNVLKGDMSLVGPRPIIESELEKYGEYVSYYLSVKPGMTGLWQVSGRNDVSYDERVQLDVEYVKNQSFLFDLKILVKTAFVIFGKNGAY